MTDLSAFEQLTIVAVVLCIPVFGYGIWLKRERDRLHRLVEQEEAELARRPAE